MTKLKRSQDIYNRLKNAIGKNLVSASHRIVIKQRMQEKRKEIRTLKIKRIFEKNNLK
jgi:hypothetical protein